MDELDYITESAPLTKEQCDYILKWRRKRTVEKRRDLTLEELLKLASIDPVNGKGIEAYQQMHAFQSGMEAIERMAGRTSEELDKVSESIRKLAQPEHN